MRKPFLMLVGFLFVVLLVVCTATFHVITGGTVGFRVVLRDSFSLSETFVNVDEITGMPWIAAKARFPLGCRVLQREGIIESDDDFRDRLRRETDEEIGRILRDSQN